MDETIDIQLIAHTYGGECLGRLPDGRAVFVPFTLPGEFARIRVVEERRGHSRAELVEIIEPGAERATARCKHFGECGGCHYQHMSYSAQLKAKQTILIDQLTRLGGLINPNVNATFPCSQPFNYRNTIQFHLASQGQLGYHRQRSNTVLPIQECHLPEEPLNLVWPQLEMEEFPELERVSLRLGVDDIQLILESTAATLPEFSVEDISLSAVHLSPAGAVVLAGSSDLALEVLGRTFRVSAGSFFQVNTRMAEAMVQHVQAGLRAYGALQAGATVLDVYCGVGLFSAFLAPAVGRLIGIEASEAACRDFAVNLDEHEHVELYQAPAEMVLSHLEVQPAAVIIDPPRAGLERRAMEGLLRLAPAVVAYISCDPATLARDARRLAAGGYRLEQATPFDLFPQTYHIESISWWTKI